MIENTLMCLRTIPLFTPLICLLDENNAKILTVFTDVYYSFYKFLLFEIIAHRVVLNIFK